MVAINLSRIVLVLIAVLALGYFAIQTWSETSGDFVPSAQAIDFLSIPWEEYIVGEWHNLDEPSHKRIHKYSAPDLFFMIDMEEDPGNVLLETRWEILDFNPTTAIVAMDAQDTPMQISDITLIRISYTHMQTAYHGVVVSTWERR